MLYNVFNRLLWSIIVQVLVKILDNTWWQCFDFTVGDEQWKCKSEFTASLLATLFSQLVIPYEELFNPLKRLFTL